MKKIVIISFATKEFKKAQKKLKNSIKRFMSTDVEVRTYAPRDIDKNFKKENFYLIESKRGFGYWLWKPYFIDKTIKTLKDDDIVVYLDSGVELISNPDPLLKLLDELPLALFKTHCHFNKDWTKRDAFVLMDVNFEECAHTEQVAGGYQLYKVCKQSRDFVEQYLKYCLDPRILSDDMNTLEQQNYDGFRDHRHDQSVLSLLSWKYK